MKKCNYLAQKASKGDMEAAAKLGEMLAPMILEQVHKNEMSNTGSPIFRRGGKLS